MQFRIEHTTEYGYSEPAMESHSEVRVRPRSTLRQVVIQHETSVAPRVPLEGHTDYFGNWVETFSVPFRHQRLVVTSRSTVQTRHLGDPLAGLDLSVSEAVHLYLPKRREMFDFLMPSRHVTFSPLLTAMSAELLPTRLPFVDAVRGLCTHLFRTYKYEPGATTISTPLAEVVAKRRGVCQDFAHLMIALLRLAGIPARYVSGYIETEAQAAAASDGGGDSGDGLLIGATASHGWVEFFTPNRCWVGIDPTNDQLEGERHVQIGVGRDYADVPPLRGVFQGAQQQRLSVKVLVARTPGSDDLPSGEPL
jgi:transglutaminase-like putative cysteine protease